MWIRYDAVRGNWEVSDTPESGVFSDLIENHPRETKFGRWADFAGFVDARPITKDNPIIRPRMRFKVSDEFKVRVPRRSGWDDGTQLPSISQPPPVSPSGYGRLYFNGTTFRVSQSGSAFQDLTDKPLIITIGSAGGGTITTGVKWYIPCPISFKITGWTIVADASGSIVVDIWKDTYANFPPVVADTIAGSNKPTLSAQQKNQNLTLSGWGNTNIVAGDVLGVNVDSATTVQMVVLTIHGYMN